MKPKLTINLVPIIRLAIRLIRTWRRRRRMNDHIINKYGAQHPMRPLHNDPDYWLTRSRDTNLQHKNHKP